jgi:5-methylthioribose kinase
LISDAKYTPLTTESLGKRLSDIKLVLDRLGDNFREWDVKEVGDGNLNLVFIVKGHIGSVIVKQALPYVRLVGDSWPLPLKRSFFEYNALIRQEKRDPGKVPEVYYFNEEQAIIVMEYLSPHTILRGKLIKGEKVHGLAETLGKFCARTAFRGSDLSMVTSERKSDAALFLDNVALMQITEDLVFTDPYYDAERNNHNKNLDPLINKLRLDVVMKIEVQKMLGKYISNGETMLHGDLHSGSVMCTENETKIIDPEFCSYGPMGFDIGMLISNFLMSYFSQPAHRNSDKLVDYQNWILDVIEQVSEVFKKEFQLLWLSERFGILYPQSLFEGQGQSSGVALENTLKSIWSDALGFCGIEMHRRLLSLAHNADFELIDDQSVKATLEARNLMMGRELILNKENLYSAKDLTSMARKFNKESFL